MKRLIIASVAVVGMLLVTAGTSNAGVRFSFGGGGYHSGHNHYGHGYRGGYGGGYGYAPTYRYYNSYPQWHNTSHYDYHPPSLQRHRNHYHYVPGHYDYHQTGHWHH